MGHCVMSFQDSFGDDLVKDNGTMAFYAFSKINFVLYLARKYKSNQDIKNVLLRDKIYKV